MVVLCPSRQQGWVAQCCTETYQEHPMSGLDTRDVSGKGEYQITRLKNQKAAVLTLLLLLPFILLLLYVIIFKACKHCFSWCPRNCR